MTNNHNPNQGKSQRRHANQPAMPPACTTPTTTAPTVTIIIPDSRQVAFAHRVIHHQQHQHQHEQQTSPSISYEDPTPVMDSQVDVDVEMFQRMDIEDDQTPDVTPSSGVVDQLGQSIHQQQPVYTFSRVVLSPLTAASQSFQSHPIVFGRPFDMTVGRPFGSTTASSPSSTYQTTVQSETATRLSNDQSDFHLRPLSQSEITLCLGQQQQQQQGDVTPSQPHTTSLGYSCSTAFNPLSLRPFGQSSLDFGTLDPVPAMLLPSTASSERQGYTSVVPSSSHLTYNSNSGIGHSSFLMSNSSSSATLAPAPAATTNTPAFGESSFPASVTQISATTSSKPLAPIPPSFTLMSPSLSHTAAYLQYKHQQPEQEQFQAMSVDIPSSSSSVTQPISNTTAASHLDVHRPSQGVAAFLLSIKEEHNRIHQELLRLIHRCCRSVQKRRRCMTDTDSERETKYSNENHCQSLPRPFDRRRSPLRCSGKSRKDRKKANRAMKDLQITKHLISRKRKLLHELNERAYQVQMLCSSAPMLTPPSPPSAKDIRTYQKYRALAASIDYSRIHPDPKEMREYQELERVEGTFLREKSNFELARLEEIATAGVSSVESKPSTILSSGLTPAEWLESQGWIFSPPVDPLMVFTMQAPNEPAGEGEESGVPILAPSTATPRSTVEITSTTGTSPTATSPLTTPAHHSLSTTISTSSASTGTPRGNGVPPQEHQRTWSQSRHLEFIERSNRNKELRETAEVRKQKEEVLKEERAQAEAMRKARKVARQAQIQKEEDDEVLAEDTQKQEERDWRREISVDEGSIPLEKESRQAWIKNQLEKKRIREYQLNVDYQELLKLERYKEEEAFRKLLEQKQKEEGLKEHKETRKLQVLRYEEDITNTPLSRKGEPPASGSTLISASSPTTAGTPVLTRTTSYVAERDSTPRTKSMIPSVFDSATTATRTTSSSPVSESSPAHSYGQELPSVSLPEMSETERELEEMNHWADQNVEYHDRVAGERYPSLSDMSSESSRVSSSRSIDEQNPRDDSTTNLGQKPRSASMRWRTVDEIDYEEEYEQQNNEYEEQQQGYEHKQQVDDNAHKGSSSNQRRRTPQKMRFERDEVAERNLQNLEDPQRLSAQEEIGGDTARRLPRSEGERVTSGAAGTKAGARARDIITLQEQQLLNDLAMALRMQQEEDDDERRSDIKSNRRTSLRINAQKKRLLSSSSDSRTSGIPLPQSKKTSGSTQSTSSAGKQQRQKSTRKSTRKLSVSSPPASALTTPAQVSSPSIQSAVEYSPPALSWPPPQLSPSTYPRRILVSSLLSASRSPSPTQWSFSSLSRSSSRSPPRMHSTLNTSYATPTSPRARTRESPPPPRTRSSPTRSSRPSSPRAPYSPQLSPPQAGTEHQYLSSWWSYQPEKAKSGLNLLAKAASIRSPSLSTLSTAVSTPKGEQRYDQVSQGYSTPNGLAGEDATISMTQTSSNDQPSPQSKAGSPVSTTGPATPAESGRESPTRPLLPHISRRSQRIQDRNATAIVLEFLSGEKEREKKEQRKAKHAKKKGRKPSAAKEETKEEEIVVVVKNARRPKSVKDETKKEVKETKTKGRKPKAVKVETKEEVEKMKKRVLESKAAKASKEETKEKVKEAKTNGRKRKVAEEAKEEVEMEEVKTKGRKRKATEKAKEEVKEVNKDPKRKTATEKAREEVKAKNVKGKGMKAKK
ncbi:hypothetical protein BG015_009026 [Linnemannia schmuckeri]|uniref:Uncharacterized protein n=1 Tax=Linnemannia schmuckeri TaxID=64567 RepID=A0A9P5RZL2_9FUNG|nr:hypothetical protein BG015_009026 [Linnemannia schmuckeri]